MQHCEMDPEWMQWIPCSVAQWIPIECSGFHAARLNAVNFMQSGAMYLDYWNVFYAAWCNWYRFNAMDSMQCDWMHWIPCIGVKCIQSEYSGLHAAWPNGSCFNAVDTMWNDWMHWIPCSVVKCIPSERSGLHAAWGNVSRLHAVESMQHAAMDTDWMHWIHCSIV